LDDLNVHMLAKHEDKELDEYYSALYENLKHTIKENPNMGKEDMFTVQSYRMFESYQGSYSALIGINRNQQAINNDSINLSLYNKNTKDHFMYLSAIIETKKQLKMSLLIYRYLIKMII